MPGAGFKRLAREWRKLSTALVNEPYEEVKRKMTAGTAEPCFVSSCLEDSYNDQGISEKLIKSSAAVAYAAGVDTVCHFMPHRRICISNFV